MQLSIQRMPPDWTKVPKITTRTQLLENRKKEQIPDISYDIDGDGIVNCKDYYISKKFDSDHDGKLTTEERAKAQQALNSGFEENFAWGFDSQGKNRSFRIIQKRGNVITNEEFTSVQKSYPEYPVIAHPPIKSKSELDEYRKKEKKAQGKLLESKMHKEYKEFHLDPFSKTDGFVKISEGYSKNPRFRTKLEMETAKKQNLLEQLNSSYNYNHISQYQRLEMREKEITPSKNTEKLSVHEKIRKENIEHFSKTFFNRSLGMHGKELPKFSENLKEYWASDVKRKVSEDKLRIASEDCSSLHTERDKKRGYSARKDKKNQVVKKPTEMEVSEYSAIKDHCRDSRWSNFHYKFLQKTLDVKQITKSSTPDVSNSSKGAKTPKPLIIHRMMKKGFNPVKDQFRSTGFSN